MTIQEFQAKLSFRLLLWSLISVTLGFLMTRGGKFWKSVGIQFITWGLIDGAIAAGGQIASDRRLANTPENELPEQLHKDKRNLGLALWCNAVLDVFYVLAGFRWIARNDDDSTRGNGIGVMIQGAFLLFFDIYHALKLSRVDQPSDD